MTRAPLAFSSNEQRSKPLDAARLLNLFAEQPPLGSRAPSLSVSKVSAPLKSVLYGTPGLKAFATITGTGGIRAGRYALGYQYWLLNASLYRVDSAGAATLCTGDSIPEAGVAMMTDNGVQLTVLSNGLSFVVAGTAVTRITADAYPAAGVSSIDTTDGYTIFSTASGGVAVYGTATDITGITNADPAVVTAIAHGLSNNNQTYIQSVAGMTEVNGLSFTVLVVDSDHFKLIGIDSSAYTAYSSGGTQSPVLAQASGQFFISALYDSATISALDFASAESSPDPLIRVLVHNREIWLFGTQTIEPWQDTGGSPFPFERVSGAIMEIGCAASLSPAKTDSSVFWLGDDKVVYRSQGYQPVRISHSALEEALRAAGDCSGAIGMNYSQGGHTYYVLTFGQRTWVYNVATQGWHERQTGTDLTYAPWAVSCMISVAGKTYAGVSSALVTNSKICELDLDTFTDVGTAIRRAVVTAPLYPDGKRATLNLVELECELGVGLNTGQGSAPQIMVRWSDDGGATFSNQRLASIGATGQRRTRAIVRRMGVFRQREIEIAISDPVKVAFYGMRYEATALGA